VVPRAITAAARPLPTSVNVWTVDAVGGFFAVPSVTVRPLATSFFGRPETPGASFGAGAATSTAGR
jgi:hypothetical protein